MHYQNDTFLFLLQEVSLKYHKSSIKYHKSSMKYHKSSMKYHKNSLLTILPRNRPNLWALNAHSMGNRCPTHGLSMPITWALNAHLMGIDRPCSFLYLVYYLESYSW